MTPTEQFWWNWAVYAVTALATTLVAVLAIWGEKIRHWFFQPSLRLSLKNPQGELTTIQLGWRDPETGEIRSQSEQARLYHVRVSNPRHRWLPIKGVMVHLLQVQELGPDGIFQGKWIGDVPLRFRHFEVMPAQRTIGSEADADLCMIVRDRFELLLLVQPNNLDSRRYGTMRMRVVLQARGIEADSNQLTLDIAWNGKWHDGAIEMGSNLTIKEVTPRQGR
jgi:hypothetical protein